MVGIVNDLLEQLQNCPLVRNVRIISYDETPTGKLEVKLRCQLVRDYQLQVWLHHEPSFRDYAYQLFTNQPILRWDNAPHYPHISTAPHHFHDEDGNVIASMLTGNTLDDLQQVLSALERWIGQTAT
jgi:hypothetical protein